MLDRKKAWQQMPGLSKVDKLSLLTPYTTNSIFELIDT